MPYGHHPLLSVIIPTSRRPQLLPRAIESALQTAPDGEAEIIVVPNGPDESWRIVANHYANDGRIKWHPIAKAHANAARNFGLRSAKGAYIRFLDDDDYLLPGATMQVKEAHDRNLEICSGSVQLMSHDLTILRTMKNSSDADFISNILGPRRKTGFQFYVYRTEAISSLSFDESIDIGQDTNWTHNLCRSRDWSWKNLDVTVCTWVQHMDAQISHGLNYAQHLRLQESILWETIQSLHVDGRLSEPRRSAAARGMWDLIHRAYFFSPHHWRHVLRKTQRFFPATYPELALYQYKLGRLVDPAVLEAVMAPKRRATYARRKKTAGSGSPW